MNLFSWYEEEKELAGDKKSHFKIDADALTPRDLWSLARATIPFIPPFDEVVGVPRGGLKLAMQFAEFRTEDAEKLLIVDDVWTTGGTVKRFYERLTGLYPSGNEASEDVNFHVVVLFSRQTDPLPEWVTAIFHWGPKIGLEGGSPSWW